jgi:hypothetical protein
MKEFYQQNVQNFASKFIEIIEIEREAEFSDKEYEDLHDEFCQVLDKLWGFPDYSNYN